MRPMLAEMDGRAFRSFMEAFLRHADRSWGRTYNLAWALGMFVGPIVALVFLWNDPRPTAFVLTAVGLVIVFGGVIVVSNVVKTPHYKVMLGWDPEDMPPDWEAGRRKYFAVNWWQCATTWAAFGLFTGALASL